jgi:DNA-binding NtrC family response regulator
VTTILAWEGTAPVEGVRRLCKLLDVELIGKVVAAAQLVVCSTATARVPQPPGHGLRWLWVCAAKVPAQAEQEAARRGAYDSLCTDEPNFLQRLEARLRELTTPAIALPATPGIIAQSPLARRALEAAYRAAHTSMPVLLTGETGSGKEVMASLLHRWSERKGPFMPLNCAAIPNELMESELFGHARGAFSGAVAAVDGKLLAATGGTVFLDEIDDTPMPIQAKLLRVLEDGEVTRLGETQARRPEFRLVAATNRNLLSLVEQGKFGRDFYERLAIVCIELPRLAERTEDIAAFVQHFMARFYERDRRDVQVKHVADGALAALCAYDWPGNIRELRNVVYQALTAKHAGCELLLSDVVPFLGGAKRTGRVVDVVDLAALDASIAGERFNLRNAVNALERQAITRALQQCAGSPSRAAKLLGDVGRGTSSDPGGTVRAMMRRLKIPG